MFIIASIIFAAVVADPVIPTIGADFQTVLEVNVFDLKETSAITFSHLGSQGLSRIEIQSGNKSYIHIANVPENERFDVISMDAVGFDNWTCAQYAFNSMRGFGKHDQVPGNDLDDTGFVSWLFFGTGKSFNQLFSVGTPSLVESYIGQSNVRGILVDGWSAQLTQFNGMVGSVTRTVFFSADGVEVNDWDTGRVPVRMTVVGTLNSAPANWSYEFVKFLPFAPPKWRNAELFGDCFVFRNVAAANVGDDDDDHHDDVNIPSMPALPENYTFTMEVNMFSHNTSFLLSYWQMGNQSRVDFESGGERWTDIADGVAQRRYEFKTSTPDNCTSLPLDAPTPFGGEAPQPYSPMFVPWNGQEDDDDDLIEAFFYRLGLMHRSLYQLFFANNVTMTQFKGQRNVRGVRCDQWSKRIDSLPWWPNTPCDLLVDVFVTTAGVEFNGAFHYQAPMRFAMNGTIQGIPYNHVYEIVGFQPLNATTRDAIGLFGSCDAQGQIYYALNQVATNTTVPVLIAENVTGVIMLSLVIGFGLGVFVTIIACMLKARFGFSHAVEHA